MKNKTLNVQAIENGTVIDHIPIGQGLNILKHFKLDKIKENITVGFNLKSKSNTLKDLIKIENVFFDDDKASQIALFAPSSTINIIKDYQVVNKFTSQLPQIINGIFDCINTNCATHNEPIVTIYEVKQKNNNIKLKCLFCEKIFPFEWFNTKS